MSNIGVPLKLLYEAQGLIVSLELSTGQTYRGKLISVEDNCNCQLRDVTITHRNGQVTIAEQVFIRGSQIVFFVIPDNLKHSPMFKNFIKKDAVKGLGIGKARMDSVRSGNLMAGK